MENGKIDTERGKMREGYFGISNHLNEITAHNSVTGQQCMNKKI